MNKAYIFWQKLRTTVLLLSFICINTLTIAQDKISPFYSVLPQKNAQSQLQLAMVRVDDHVFKVELAISPEEQMQGLMHRLMLPNDHGMLFVFTDEQTRRFWMKNTKIPLDILFFDANGILINIQNAVPCLTAQCPTYDSSQPARYVLELNYGIAEKLNIRPGASLQATQ